MKGIVIPTNLGALAQMAAEEDGRYAIGGIRVLDQNGAYRLEATDGKKLAIVRGEYDLSLTDGPSPLREFIVPSGAWRDAMTALAKIKNHNNVPLPAWLAAKGQDFRFEGKDYAKGGPLVEGKYPDVQQALPKTPPLVSVRFNPALLKSLCELALSLGIEGVDLLFFRPGHPLALVGHNESGQFLDALVMPLDRPDPKPPVNRVPSAPPAPAEEPPAETAPSEVEKEEPDSENGTGHEGNGDGNGNGHPPGKGRGPRKSR